jgi:hypothetical protein
MMANVHGSKARLWMDTQAGTCTEITSATTEISFTRSRSDPETTTLGDMTVQREVAGLRDATLEYSGIWDTTSNLSSVVGLMEDAYSGSLVSRFIYTPAGSTSGCPIYTTCMRIQTFAYRSPVGGVGTVNFSAVVAAGSVTAACCT